MPKKDNMNEYQNYASRYNLHYKLRTLNAIFDFHCASAASV